MDARLDTLSTELYQMNTRVSRIARRQAYMGGFAVFHLLLLLHRLLRIRMLMMVPIMMIMMRMRMLALPVMKR